MVKQGLMMIRSVESIASSRKNFSLFHCKCLPEAIALLRKHNPDTLKVLESLPRFDYGVKPPEGVRNEVQVLPGQQLVDGGGWYFGEWALGERKEMEGRGILVTKEGGVYEGWFLKGRLTGLGRYVSVEEEVYEGPFKNGVFHGRGVFKWPTGARYDGDFLQGERCGNGAMLYSNGNRYDGEWLGDKK